MSEPEQVTMDVTLDSGQPHDSDQPTESGDTYLKVNVLFPNIFGFKETEGTASSRLWEHQAFNKKPDR